MHRRILFATLGVVAVLALGVATGRFSHPALDRDRIAAVFGFGIDQVSLTGHRFTADGDIFDALDLSKVRSMASFDASSIRARFEQLPWVQSAEITRIWPGQIAIHVTERKAFAIWEKEDSATLIDSTGRVLGPVKRDAALNLPRVSGEGANVQAASVLATLDRYPDLRARVVRLLRVGDRRWTLELNGGVLVHLPADGEASALSRLATEAQLAAFIATPGQVVDLRALDRIAVRSTVRPEAQTPAAVADPQQAAVGAAGAP